jgi:hypothetical protein
VNQLATAKNTQPTEPTIDDLIDRVQSGQWTRLQLLQALAPVCVLVMRAARDPRSEESQKVFKDFLKGMTPVGSGKDAPAQARRRLAWLEQLKQVALPLQVARLGSAKIDDLFTRYKDREISAEEFSTQLKAEASYIRKIARPGKLSAKSRVRIVRFRDVGRELIERLDCEKIYSRSALLATLAAIDALTKKSEEFSAI